jgi:heptosyltransferase II
MAKDPKRILIFVPNWLGDVAMCTPALRTIHQRFPDAELTVVGRGGACGLLKGLQYIDHFVAIPARPGFWEMVKLSRQLKPLGRDLAIVFPHSFRAALLARLSGSQRVLGYDRGIRGWLLTDRVEPHRVEGKVAPTYMVWEYNDLLKPLGAQYDGFGLELAADAQAIAQVQGHIVGDGPLVGFAPGAAFGPSKQWPVERFAAVADALVEQLGVRCVLLTGPGEEDTKNAFLALCKHPVTIYDEGKPTIDSLKATISLLDLLVCNDSGPRHIAISFQVPTVCIMGSTRPVYSLGPYEKGDVVRIDVDCGPCQKPVCETDHRCMTGVSPEAIVSAACKYI